METTNNVGQTYANALYQSYDVTSYSRLLWQDPTLTGWKCRTSYRWTIQHTPSQGTLRYITPTRLHVHVHVSLSLFGQILLISVKVKGGGQSTLPNDSYAYISIFGCFAVFSNDFSDGSMNVMFQVVCEGGGVSGR